MRLKRLLYIAGLLLCCSCDNMLDVEPEIAVTYTNYFQNEQDVHKTYIDMYAKLREVYFRYQLQPHHKMGLVYDQCNEYYSYADELKNLSAEAFKKVDGTSWLLHYNVIFQSNLILDNLYRVQDLPKDRENFYRGHCYFAKGLMYYEIARRWGNAPITRDSKSIDPLGRSDAKVVLDTALSNALRAFDLLKNYEEAVDYNGQKLKKYYAHKGAAAALLANIYAWKGGVFNDPDAYKETEKYCTLIIENKVGIYKMVDTPEEVCSVVMDRLSSESVFELLNSSIDFGFTTGRFSPGINFHIGENYGSGGYPLNPFGSLSNNQYENLYLIKNDRVKKIWSDGDLRRTAYFWKFDEMAAADEEITGGFAYPYFWRKPLLDAAWDPAEMINVDGNKIFWRLAEIYLLRAEARCRANLPGAEDDLNCVRNRAHAKAYPADTDTEGLQMAIFREREREMFFDGERYYDIVRNGYYTLPGMISEVFEQLTEQDVKDGALYVPIMDTEMQRNTLMRQNPYWLARW